MMAIRPEQLEAFRRAALERFESQMLLHLRQAFGDQCGEMEDDELRRFIGDGIVRAAAHGITRAADVARFIEYLLCCGPAFEARPDVAEILRSPLDGTARMDAIDALELEEE